MTRCEVSYSYSLSADKSLILQEMAYTWSSTNRFRYCHLFLALHLIKQCIILARNGLHSMAQCSWETKLKGCRPAAMGKLWIHGRCWLIPQILESQGYERKRRRSAAPSNPHQTSQPTCCWKCSFHRQLPTRLAQKTGEASKEQATRLPQLCTLRRCWCVARLSDWVALQVSCSLQRRILSQHQLREPGWSIRLRIHKSRKSTHSVERTQQS